MSCANGEALRRCEVNVLERPVLEALVGDVGGRAVVREIVRAYLDLLPVRQRAIAEAARVPDLLRLRREAHTLGSASATVGAAELAGLCRELELLGVGREDTPAPVLPQAWASTCTATRDAFEAWCAEP